MPRGGTTFGLTQTYDANPAPVQLHFGTIQIPPKHPTLLHGVVTEKAEQFYLRFLPEVNETHDMNDMNDMRHET